MYFICRSAPETRPRTNFACLLSASTTASASLAPSGETKAVAIFRSGDMRTSETEMTVISISGSRMSPRCKHLGQRVANLFANAKHALGRASSR